MAKVEFVRALNTSNYGLVNAGDTVDVSDEDAARYENAGIATRVKAPAKKAARKKA